MDGEMEGGGQVISIQSVNPYKHIEPFCLGHMSGRESLARQTTCTL